MIDITNQKFGRWTVISKSKNKRGDTYLWICKCECGTVKEMLSGPLRYNKSRSCGCLQKEEVAKRSFRHGLCDHKLYGVWRSMKSRCYNKKCPSYVYYGERGILICYEWYKNFETFYNWAIDKWESRLTIDRINNNGHYEPLNCRFVNKSIQNLNKRYKNKTGVRYVSKNGNKFQVKKIINGKKKHFGVFETLEEAKKVADNL